MGCVVVCCFSLVLEHCKRVSFAVGYLDLSGGFVLLYSRCGRACNIVQITAVGCFCPAFAVVFGCGFHCLRVFAVGCFSLLAQKEFTIFAGRLCASLRLLLPKFAGVLGSCSLALFIGGLCFLSEIFKIGLVVGFINPVPSVNIRHFKDSAISGGSLHVQFVALCGV